MDGRDYCMLRDRIEELIKRDEINTEAITELYNRVDALSDLLLAYGLEKKKAETVKSQPDCGCLNGCKAWDCPRA